ncbi:MAG: hypothetical protein ACPMAQ_18305, partial [Phycisphaerae bacterium]
YVAWQEEGRANAATRSFLSNGWWAATGLDGKTTTVHGSAVKLTAAPVFLRATQSPILRQ